MARRRRAVRKNTRGKSSPRRPVKRSQNKTLKERFLTTAIWGLSLINITLIFSLLSNFFASEGETALSARVTPEGPPVKIITVQVLNGCGVQGLANEITQYLRNKNFDVVDVGNYEGGYLDQTLVLDRVSLESKYAKKVAKALGVNEKLVTPTLEKSLQLMVTVIIGRDYKKLKIYRELQN
ncbi:LytR C-terminal domain-containing protein [candidate division KSB1 bacterium]|nr:LytR C-terminal domain-containing protein [candidate division KSB1 bacterium]TDI91828.1 MAG: LytR family transcriptional regulator [Caldithrix sp.]TDI98404.1 MAG: LytR family transcriptional regulator [Caldithrix sp.]